MSEPPYWGEEQPRYEPYRQPPPAPPGYPIQPGYPSQAGYPMPYAGPYPGAAYGVDPVTGAPLSDKSKVAAGVLQLVLALVGVCGVGRLYAGHIGIGLTQLLGAIVSYIAICALIGLFTLPIFVLWSVIDGIVILASAGFRDGQGRLMR